MEPVLSDDEIRYLQSLAQGGLDRLEELDQKKFDELKTLIEKIRFFCEPRGYNYRIFLWDYRGGVEKDRSYFLHPAEGKIYCALGVNEDDFRKMQNQRMVPPSKHAIQGMAEAQLVSLDEMYEDYRRVEYPYRNKSSFSLQIMGGIHYRLERVLARREWEKGAARQ